MLYNMGDLMSVYMLYDQVKLTFYITLLPSLSLCPLTLLPMTTVYPPDNSKGLCVINKFYFQCLQQVSSILLAQNLLCSLC